MCNCIVGVIAVAVIPWAYDINNNVTTNSVELRRVIEGFDSFSEALETQEKLIYQTREDLLKAVPSSGRIEGLHDQVNILYIAIERVERRVDHLEKAN